MKSKIRLCALCLILFLTPVCALAAEGDPLLSVDDLMALEESYGAFLDELEDLIVERGLLSEEERETWRDVQMGDFFQNGGYGSVLANYMPGLLGYVREEETLLELSCLFEDGSTFSVDTMRRYTPRDSSLSGLMLTLRLTDASGAPVNAAFSLTATSGVFMKWDAMMSAYASVGARADSDGETVVWSDQAPLVDAKNPVITIAMTDPETKEPLPHVIELTLTVSGDGYQVSDGALAVK
jgi:hypothetical protein